MASFILQTLYNFFSGSPTSSRGSSATSESHVCRHVRLFLQLLTGTQVAGRQNNNLFQSGVYVLLFVILLHK